MPDSRRKRARRIRAGRHLGQPLRWRRASNSATPAATEMLRDSTCPAMGIRTTKSQRSRVNRLIQRLGGCAVRPYHPNTPLFEQAQHTRQIGHGRDRDEFRCTGGDFARHPIHGGGTVFRDEHRVNAGRIGGPKARTEVVGVGHPIQHQQQRSAARGIAADLTQVLDQIVLIPGFEGPHGRHGALMRHIADQLGQRLAADGLNTDAHCLCAFLQISGAGVVPRLCHPQLQQSLRRARKYGTDGVQSIDEIAFAISHARAPCRPSTLRPPG
jgi:hypothetical protein